MARARTPAFLAHRLRASPLHSMIKTQNAKSKIVNWHAKLVRIFLIQNVFQRFKEICYQHDYICLQSLWDKGLCKTAWNMRCVRWCHYKTVFYLTHIEIFKYKLTIYNIYTYIYLDGENTFFQYFFWLVKCPKSSTKQILNANGKILRLQTWQRSNSIVHQPSFLQIKSTKADRNDMNWCEDTNSSPKWYLESLSWCFFSGLLPRVSDHVFSTTWCDIPQ